VAGSGLSTHLRGLGIVNTAWILGFVNYMLEIAPEEARTGLHRAGQPMMSVMAIVPTLGGWLLAETSYPALFGTTTALVRDRLAPQPEPQGTVDSSLAILEPDALSAAGSSWLLDGVRLRGRLPMWAPVPNIHSPHQGRQCHPRQTSFPQFVGRCPRWRPCAVSYCALPLRRLSRDTPSSHRWNYSLFAIDFLSFGAGFTFVSIGSVIPSFVAPDDRFGPSLVGLGEHDLRRRLERCPS